MRDQRAEYSLRRSRHAGRRHLATAHLANDFLPGLRTGGDVRQREGVERQAAGPRALVVTADAVLIDHRALRRTSGRGLARARPRALTLADDGSQHDDPRDEADLDTPDHPRPFPLYLP